MNWRKVSADLNRKADRLLDILIESGKSFYVCYPNQTLPDWLKQAKQIQNTTRHDMPHLNVTLGFINSSLQLLKTRVWIPLLYFINAKFRVWLKASITCLTQWSLGGKYLLAPFIIAGYDEMGKRKWTFLRFLNILPNSNWLLEKKLKPIFTLRYLSPIHVMANTDYIFIHLSAK